MRKSEEKQLFRSSVKIMSITRVCLIETNLDLCMLLTNYEERPNVKHKRLIEERERNLNQIQGKARKICHLNRRAKSIILEIAVF